MCYEPQPEAKCSCGHHWLLHKDIENPVLSENHEGACRRCQCPAYDGLPMRVPQWIFHVWRGMAITREDELRRPVAVKDHAPDGKPEHYYRDLLARQVGGRAEVTLAFGRADVVTDTTVYEVEPAGRWREGVSQALQYAAQVPQRGAIALYGNGVTLAKVQAALAALPPPGLELWWLEGEQFVRIEAGRLALPFPRRRKLTSWPER